MTKVQVLDSTGKKTKDIDTKIFDGKIREDLVQKIVEVEKSYQPHSASTQAGMQTSASGNVRHLRHSWKSDRGRGMSRVPKKRMSRRGDRFHWIAAVVPGTRGGRRAHGPKIVKRIGKINKKELISGLKSALAMIASPEKIKEKYATLKNKEFSAPLVIESKTLELKTKEFLTSLEKILGQAKEIGFQKKSVRAGRGKLRNRKYKKTAGLLMIIGDKEAKKINNIEILNASDIMVSDLASNGARITIFTEAAISDMEAKLK